MWQEKKMRASFEFVVTFCVLLEFLIIFTKSKATVIKGRSDCDINCTSRIIIRSSDIYNNYNYKKASGEKKEDFVMNSGKETEAKIETETEKGGARTESKLEIAKRRHLKRGKY